MCDTFCDSDKLKKNLSPNLSYITITITNANMHFKGCDVIEDILCDKCKNLILVLSNFGRKMFKVFMV